MPLTAQANEILFFFLLITKMNPEVYELET